MPIYEYLCSTCQAKEEVYRHIADRERAMLCPQGHTMERMYSVPALAIWDAERRFPNAVKFGEGKFASKAAYETHLKVNDMAETRIDGKNKSRVPRSMRG